MAILPFMVPIAPGSDRVVFREELMFEVEKTIDQALSSSSGAMVAYRVFDNGYGYLVAHPSVLSEQEKQWVKMKYLTAGWREVEIYQDYDSRVAQGTITFIKLIPPQ